MSMNKKNIKFYRIDNFTNNPPFLAPSSFTLSQLIESIESKKLYKDFQIFFQSHLTVPQQKDLTLEEIEAVHLNKEVPPTFYICQIYEDEQNTEEQRQFYQSIKQLLQLQGQQARSEWVGANGHILFDGRDNALIASSMKHSRKIHKANSIYDLNIISSNPQPKPNKVDQTKQIQELIETLKKHQTKQQLEQYQPHTPNKKFSNYDINFITTLETTYLSYMLKTGFKLSYVDYKQWSFGVIPRKIKSNEKIGIIGDYGTGLDDSWELMQNMIVKEGVGVILHLGDVYYAGTPEEYENNVGRFVKKLRVKTQRQILFYSIPGNHDYYSWGMPFLCFVKEINSEQFTKQMASYFCLRTEDDKWQFLGADTAFHDSNPFDQINQVNLGPRLRNKELAWHKHKLQTFQGSTIFMTHHQLYSIHDRICGSLSKYRHFSCINPILNQQLFQYMPYFSAWFWGHEHSFMLFRQNFWGLSKCRLLGNSSFHVIFDKQHPYKRTKQFPKIPFIEQDDKYLQRYIPLNPKNNTGDYFNLCYAVIDLQKSKENLAIQYYCSASFSEKNKYSNYFNRYKIYEEVIYSKNEIIKNAKIIKCREFILLKNQIGLLLQLGKNQKLRLGFSGQPLQIIPVDEGLESVLDGSVIYLAITQDQKQLLYISQISKDLLVFQREKTGFSEWIIRKKYVMHDSSAEITSLSTFILQNKSGVKLGIELTEQGPIVSPSKKQSLWTFLSKQHAISDEPSQNTK